jgi:hypothetical protein
LFSTINTIAKLNFKFCKSFCNDFRHQTQLVRTLICCYTTSCTASFSSTWSILSHLALLKIRIRVRPPIQIGRSGYLAATKFKAFVLPPLDEDARPALEKTLRKWLSAGGIDEIDEVDENARSTETKVREEYDAVLKLLEEGIDDLGGE